MRQIIGIHVGDSDSFSTGWAEAVYARGLEVRHLDLLGADPLGQVEGCDGVMWHWAHYPHEQRMAALPILRVIEEHLYLPVFPDMATCWHFDDKIAQSYLLEALGIPQPKTWVFWRKTDALAWCKQAAFPVVAKLSGGAGSANVRLIHSVAEARHYVAACFSGSGIVIKPSLPAGVFAKKWAQVKRMAKRGAQVFPYVLSNRFPALPDQTYWMPQKNYALFQEFLPGNEFDTRVTVIGKRAFAFRRFNRPNDFRASGSGKIDYDPGAIDLRCVSAALEASRKLKSQSMAYDFMFRGEDQEPVVGEISYCYANWAIAQCSGHWDSDLNWQDGSRWPEEVQVEDLLARIREDARER